MPGRARDIHGQREIIISAPALARRVRFSFSDGSRANYMQTRPRSVLLRFRTIVFTNGKGNVFERQYVRNPRSFTRGVSGADMVVLVYLQWNREAWPDLRMSRLPGPTFPWSRHSNCLYAGKSTFIYTNAFLCKTNNTDNAIKSKLWKINVILFTI